MDISTAPPRWAYDTLPLASSCDSLADAALGFAQSGIAVFPCARGGKEPLTAHGFKDATADPGRVAWWWRRFPEANLGLPTGAFTGVDVVDVDVHGAASGFPAMAKAREAGLVGEWVWCVRTPSGGMHVYFPHPVGVEQRSWQSPRTHVDFRGDGGYVIAPPSRIEVDGAVRRYEVIAVANHAPGPVDSAALRRFLDPPVSPRSPGYEPARGGADPEALAYFVRNAQVGGRNSALFWAACRMVEASFDYASTIGVLGNAAVDNGLSPREAERTVVSAFQRTAPLPSSADHTPDRAARPEPDLDETHDPFGSEVVSL
ncbi:MAG: bifunctional DNA primase/polymerase [Cellulomonadaceae bacterium]